MVNQHVSKHQESWYGAITCIGFKVGSLPQTSSQGGHLSRCLSHPDAGPSSSSSSSSSSSQQNHKQYSNNNNNTNNQNQLRSVPFFIHIGVHRRARIARHVAASQD